MSKLVMKKINYADLNARQQEIYNFQKVAAELADYGFNCIKLADDWQGADFIAYRNEDSKTLKVQLKGRLSIDKKYENKDIYMAFHVNENWYLIPHDELIKIVGGCTDWLKTESWQSKGFYHSAKPSKQLLEAIKEYII